MYQLSISIAERMYENHLLNKG
ncbi:TPA: hypothetical protein ACF82L_001636 [Streptococcus pyogenes]